MSKSSDLQEGNFGPPVSITHRRATANGLDHHYLVAGDGDPILLLHGFPQHSLMWRRLMTMLAAHHRVIAPDLRGAGGTTIMPGGYDKRTMAADMQALLSQLVLHPVDVVGYDHGAGVAYQLAARHPDFVRRLCVIEYALPGFGYEAEMAPRPDWNAGSAWQLGFFTVPEVAEHFMRGRERDLLTWFFWHAACNPSAVTPEDFEEYVRQICKPGALRAGINYYAAVWQDMTDHKEAARTKLNIPILALGGECSYGEKVFEAWRSLADDVRGGLIKDAGHWPADENPAEMARLVLEFFDGEDQPALKSAPTSKPDRLGNRPH
ncbi:alpha/beta hydrolase [Bradyrhizobium sp. CB1650]|uniref:alpha/beta fold hydrolase n=1 Tax=Bradyrhizobium sp. CB1650 TaxID=3039153 RepID=UPI00243579BD|nr:alpha/beta hydrolase [Bradyrhizobium sp. CB1650]WGD49092.1 alpha/beta hydrolase [Bradyrhizobium sp. CB1650]